MTPRALTLAALALAGVLAGYWLRLKF